MWEVQMDGQTNTRTCVKLPPSHPDARYLQQQIKHDKDRYLADHGILYY